jgi:hypothetical protein
MSKAEVIYEKVRALPDAAQTAVLRTVELLSESEGPQTGAAHGLRRTFAELAEAWRRETQFISFVQQRVVHPAYQRIIGMGWAAVPLILRELQRQPEHWLWALQAITGEEPARNASGLQAASEAWLRWGRERGLLPDAQTGH